MITLRLEEKPIQIGERTYTLRVNMSVLERIQEECGGQLKDLMQKSMYDGNAITMAAMLNDWAEDQHWEQDWTVKRETDPGQKTEDGNPDENSGN